MAAHERGRKMKLNEKRVESLLGERKTKESKVSVDQRLREFPNQSLVKDQVHGNLFCRCCKKSDIKNSKQTIALHCRSPGHIAALEAWKLRHNAEKEVKEFLSDHFKNNPTEKNKWLPCRKTSCCTGLT